MLSRDYADYFDDNELFNNKALSNLESIRLEGTSIDFDFYEENIFEKDVVKDSNHALNVSREFIDKFFDGKFNFHYNSFLKNESSEQVTSFYNFLSGDIVKKMIEKTKTITE